MIFMVVLRKIKSALFLILNLIKRCFCCLRKKSLEETLPMTAGEILNQAPNADSEWDSWNVPTAILVSDGQTNKSVSQTEQQIIDYRRHKMTLTQALPPTPEPEPDYFQDLTPNIQKHPQVVIYKHEDDDQQLLTRTSFSMTDTYLQSAGLLDWEEEEGWDEEADDEDINEALRQHKEQMREKKKAERLKKKAEKDQMKKNSKMAVKLS